MASEDDSCYFVSKINGNLTGKSILDADNITQTGLYRCEYTALNIPSANTGTITVICNPISSVITQIYISVLEDMYVRAKNYGEWGSWKQIALKSDLQSVISSLGTKSGNYDFNLLTQPGYYYVGNTDDAKNKPPYGGSGALVVYNIGSGSFIIQTFFAAHVFAMRYYVASSNTWLSWRGVRVDELA